MLDTNLILDWLLDRNPVHTKAIDKLFAYTKELVLPDYVVVELAFVLEKVYELPRDLVADNITKVIEESVFNCNRKLFEIAIAQYIKHPSLSFLDCCLLNHAELQNALPVWTFDKKLVTQSASRAKSPSI